MLAFVGTISGLFSQILNGDDASRDRCIKFLATKLKTVGRDIITKEPEDLLIAECKKVLQVKRQFFMNNLIVFNNK